MRRVKSFSLQSVLIGAVTEGARRRILELLYFQEVFFWRGGFGLRLATNSQIESTRPTCPFNGDTGERYLSVEGYLPV